MMLSGVLVYLCRSRIRPSQRELPVERRATATDRLAAEATPIPVDDRRVDHTLRKLPPALSYADTFLGQSDQSRSANTADITRYP